MIDALPLLNRDAAKLPPRPIRVLQFGTGRFLLGFVGDTIDQANCTAGYNGHALIVQSTEGGAADAICRQQGLYALVLRDADQRAPPRIVDAYAGAVRADTQWAQVLEQARSHSLEIVVSNTTEAGLRLMPAEQVDRPISYPARLTALLRARFEAGLNGLAVLPCELIDDNGAVIKDLVQACAADWGLNRGFEDWLEHDCVFANTLVDRIVPGRPDVAEHAALEAELGYRDTLMTIAEPYALWAIEGAPTLAARIGFAAGNPTIVINPDIARQRMLKLRLLNGGHTAVAALALLLGHETVLAAMRDAAFATFAEQLLRKEVGPTLDCPRAVVADYIVSTLRRWDNPFLAHRWADIAIGYEAKIQRRLLATISRADVARRGALAIGLAAFLHLIRAPHWRAHCGISTALDNLLGPADGPLDVAALLARAPLWRETLAEGTFAQQVASAMCILEAEGPARLLETART